MKPSPAATRGSGRPALLTAVPWLLLAVFGVVLLRTAWVADDAFITLRTVDNFVHGFGLRWNVVERVQSFTHPLWLFLLVPIYAVCRDPFAAALTLSLLSSAAVGWLIVRPRSGSLRGGAALLLLLSSRAFVDYSTSGLENPLSNLLLLLAAQMAAASASTRRQLLGISLATGLLALNRLDAVLLLAPLLVWSWHRFGIRRGAGAVLLGFVPFLIWEAFSLLYYGSFVPNTAFAKLNTGLPAGALLAQGAQYFANSYRNDPATLLVAAGGLLFGLLRGRGRERALAIGGVLYLLYVLKIGGDFMSGRFLAAPFLVAVILLRDLFPPSRERGLWLAAALALLLAALRPDPPFLSGRQFGLSQSERFDESGIADERAYYFGRSGLWCLAPQAPKPARISTQVGDLARRLGTPVLVEASIGFTGFAAGPGVYIVDVNALADPLLARLPMADSDPDYAAFLLQQRGTPPKRPWRIGHFVRSLPTGYLAAVVSGVNRMEDGGLARYYDTLKEITRGRVLSWRRFLHVVRWNLGRYDFLVDRARYRPYRATDWGEAIRANPNFAEAYFRRALDRAGANDASGAESDVAECLRLAPEHGPALDLAGLLAARRGDSEGALALWRRGSAVAPDLPTSHASLGDFYYDHGDPASALPEYVRVVQLDPYAGAAHNALGLALLDLGRAAEALPHLELDCRIEPRRADPWLNLASAKLMLSDRKGATGALEQALRAEPASAHALANVGAAYLSLGDAARARSLLERAVTLDPREAEAWLALAELRRQSGDATGAREALRRAADLGHPDARAALGEPSEAK